MIQKLQYEQKFYKILLDISIIDEPYLSLFLNVKNSYKYNKCFC